MSATENKVKYGLEKVAVAVATIDASTGAATYATPVYIPGARSLSLEAQGELTKWYADNIAYYIVNNTNGYEGDLEVARFPDAIRQALWSEAVAANGILYEEDGVEAVHFALLFEFKGDQKKTRHVMYNCVATRPSVAGATVEETAEPQTETCTITVTSIYVAALDTHVVKASCTEDDTQYSSWYTAVVQPTAE